jgi:Mg-chelatase subunit ChlD
MGGFLYRVDATPEDSLVRGQSEGKSVTAVLPGASQTVAPSDQMVRQELLGIHGNLKHLVFAIDKSGSMAYGGKWEYVRGVIDTWLRYLDIEQCALVVFDGSVTVFPPSGGYLDLTGADGPGNRQWLLARLAELKPGGTTNTLAALQTAYALNPDSVVLATDGYPCSGSNRFDTRMAGQAATLCRTHGHSVPIHVLALGDYFHPQLGNFLRAIAETSGGSYIGR